MEVKREMQSPNWLVDFNSSSGNGINAMCRACTIVIDRDQMVNLFDGTDYAVGLATAFSDISGINLNPSDSDGYTHYCCVKCKYRIEDAHELRNLCYQSAQKLNKMFKELGPTAENGTEFGEIAGLARMCRVCTNFDENSQMTNLFETNNAFLSLITFFCRCFDMELDTTYWPKSCCFKCKYRLQDAGELRNLCQDSDRKLRKMFFEGGSIQGQREFPNEQSSSYSDVMILDNEPQEPLVSEIKCEEYEEKELPAVKKEQNSSTETSDAESGDNTDNSDAAGGELSGKLSDSRPIVIKSENIFICCRCSIQTDSVESLIEHGTSSHKDKLTNADSTTTYCNVCYRIFSRAYSLKLHQALWTRLFKCRECSKIMYSRLDYKSHWMMNHGKESEHLRLQGHHCCGCRKVFDSADELRDHSGTVHLPKQAPPDKERPFICDVCYHNFRSDYTLQRHKCRRVAEPKRFQCEQCGGTYKRKSRLREHEKTHERAHIHRCSYCPQTFAVREFYWKHLYEHLNAVDVIKCPECSKFYTTKNALRQHLFSHTNERPLKCPHCPSTFKRKITMQCHIRGVHEKQKPYACTICPRTFGYPSDLNRHINSHNGVKPYKCEYCSQAYQRNVLLKKHVDKCHPMEAAAMAVDLSSSILDRTVCNDQ